MPIRLITGDCRDVLATLPDGSVHCVVTSPPYWGLRDYGVDGQIGLEASVSEHIAILRDVFREVRRVLRKDGTCWVNYGDAYAGGGGFAPNAPSNVAGSKQTTNRGSKEGVRTPSGLKPKDLIGLPWRLAFALQDDGWWLRSDIIWSKPNPMPESVTDRPTRAHEYVFLLTKSARYWYDAEAIRQPAAEASIARLAQNIEAQEGSHRANGGAKTNGTMKAVGRVDKQRGHGRRHDGFNDHWDAMSKDEQSSMGANARSVWEIATQPFSEAHFATFPPALAERCIKAGCPVGGTVLDPFGGAGTTGLVADRLQRNAILIELNPAYAAIAERRMHNDAPLFVKVAP
jgi:DNA modification methylase